MVSKMLEKLEKIPDKAEDMLENVEDIVQQVNDVLHELPESAENMFQAKISNHQGKSCAQLSFSLTHSLTYSLIH